MLGVCRLRTGDRTTRTLWYLQRRFRKKGKNQPKVTNIERAQEYFDISYPPIYGSRWKSIRLALLSKPKYISLINNFANYEATIESFEKLGATDIRHIYNYKVERMNEYKHLKNTEVLTKDGRESSTTEEAQAIRPSLIELDDEEIAARQKVEPMGLYPEEYRQRVLSRGGDVGSLDIDFSHRVVSPSEVGLGGDSIMVDHVPSTRLKGLENWLEETDVFLQGSVGDDQIGLKVEKQLEPIHLPSSLKIYSFSKGDITDFPSPKMDRDLKVLDHCCLDGGSVLPVLALGIEAGDKVLDTCAAPGGKSLIALQTFLPFVMVSNDVTEGRMKRLRRMLDQYIPQGLSNLQKLSILTEYNRCKILERDAYDKVLVDVPCLTDRHSLQESDNSLFKPVRTKERLSLPELQSSLLVSALHAVRPGGCVVYSTCTLSPLQNDGAVHLALSKIWQETTIDCAIVDMSYAITPLKTVYRFGTNLGLRYGQVVLPSLLSNFGPTYFAKIKRIK
ncbi:hypothetical protein Pcinc_025535 [Petrolisthes cinctipes]|uniref:NOL1/NOP2/Sun domain family member 4 n=1 Tax=Petrolisthes cinctipes TaxID=88211 RepID=A0AAE1F8L5_PETCI|nr:hypothetical protein Pcinc_025535 [Petrolisthes cinctipes]